MKRRLFLKSAALTLSGCSKPLFAAGAGLIQEAPGFYKGSESTEFTELADSSYRHEANAEANADWRSVLLSGNRDIWIKRREAGVDGRIQYINTKGGLDFWGYKDICRALGDIQASVSVYMSVDLLDILCGIQRWLIHYGYTAPIIVTSGYRTPERNRYIEGAARNSFHTKGMAVDIRIPGVSTVILGRMAQMFQRGGVGFYMNKDFVHIDVGRVRYWKG